MSSQTVAIVKEALIIVAFFLTEYAALATVFYGMTQADPWGILGGIGLFLFPPFVMGEVMADD